MPWTEITREQYRRDGLRYASDTTFLPIQGGPDLLGDGASHSALERQVSRKSPS